MAMDVEFPTSKGNVLIVEGLDPFFILVRHYYRLGKGICNVHINTNSSIGNIPGTFVTSNILTKDPIVFPMPSRISSVPRIPLVGSTS
jgi:hypothetical protein